MQLSADVVWATGTGRLCAAIFAGKPRCHVNIWTRRPSKSQSSQLSRHVKTLIWIQIWKREIGQGEGRGARGILQKMIQKVHYIPLQTRSRSKTQLKRTILWEIVTLKNYQPSTNDMHSMQENHVSHNVCEQERDNDHPEKISIEGHEISFEDECSRNLIIEKFPNPNALLHSTENEPAHSWPSTISLRSLRKWCMELEKRCQTAQNKQKTYSDVVRKGSAIITARVQQTKRRIALTPPPLLNMPILTWNVRGGCSKLRQPELHKILQERSVVIFGDVETKATPGIFKKPRRCLVTDGEYLGTHEWVVQRATPSRWNGGGMSGQVAYSSNISSVCTSTLKT